MGSDVGARPRRGSQPRYAAVETMRALADASRRDAVRTLIVAIAICLLAALGLTSSALADHGADPYEHESAPSHVIEAAALTLLTGASLGAGLRLLNRAGRGIRHRTSLRRVAHYIAVGPPTPLDLASLQSLRCSVIRV